MRVIAILLVISLAACGSGPSRSTDAGTNAADAGGPCAATTWGNQTAMDVTVAKDLEFSSYSPQDVTVCLPPGPFRQVTWTFTAQGGALAQCTQRDSTGVCNSTGDYVDRIIENGLVLGSGADAPELELDRAVTAYGGTTNYTRDLTQFERLLGGQDTFRLSVQTGCKQGGYSATAVLHLVKGLPTDSGRHWGTAMQVFPAQRVADDASAGFGSASAKIHLAEALSGATLLVFATGHNNKGQACEEFCAGAQIELTVDGTSLGTVAPVQGGNDPHCVAGCDGCGHCQASSVAREGWCPGEASTQLGFFVGALSAGDHTFTFKSLNAVTQGGYWVVSAALVAP